MILLFNPKSSTSGKPVLPMSLLSIGAVLEGRHDYVIVDGNLTADPLPALRGHVERAGADVLAITVMPGRQVRQARDISRALKAEFPLLTIVWGGYFPTMYPDACLTAPYIDFLLRGHSEEAFLALIQAVRAVRAVRAGTDPQPHAGLSWREADTGDIRHHPIGPVPDLDQLPDYPYHRLPMEQYVLSTFLGSRTLPHHASYGCPYTCNFCGVVNMVNGRYSAQSPDTLDRSVSTLVRTYRANAVQFYDNNFFVGESRTAEICERLTAYNIAWWAYGRVDTLMQYSDRTWSLMRDSGLKMVYLGVEAGSDESLERMNKGGKQTPDLALELAERMRVYGIVPEMSFVLACPPDPAEDLDRTFRFIRRIKAVNEAAEIIMYPYTPVPVDGQLYSDVQALGFQFPATLDEWSATRWIQYSERTTAALPWLTPSIQRRIGNFQRVLHAAYPTSTDPGLTGTRRAVIRAAGMWRYKLEFYGATVDLKLLSRLLPHKRPEVTGF